MKKVLLKSVAALLVAVMLCVSASAAYSTSLLPNSNVYVSVLEEYQIAIIGFEFDIYTTASFFDNDYMMIVDADGEPLTDSDYVGTGCYICLPDTNLEYVVNSYLVIVPYDLDGNGKITSADARLALRNALRLDQLSPEAEIAADVDGNGKVSSGDARAILRVALRLFN